jgi:Right handed beta helix region
MLRVSGRLRAVGESHLRRLPSLLVVTGLIAPASAAAAVGPPVPGTAVDWNSGGRAQAWQAQSTATELVDTLGGFLDSSSSLIGATYWTVGLQRSGTPGTVKYRDSVGVGKPYGSASGTLSSLPSTWSAGPSWGAHTASINASHRAASRPPPRPHPPPPLPPPPTPACDLAVSTRAALLSAVQNVANGGRTVCAHASDYGPELRIGVRHVTKLTLRAYPGERVTLPDVVLAGVSKLRVEGFDMPQGGFDTPQQSDRDIELVRNEIHDCACEALRLWSGDAGVLFQGNYVHDIRYDGNWNTGWGINATGSTTGVKVRYNTFDGLRNDAIEIAGSDDGEIVGNVIERIYDDPAFPDTHADSMMLWAGSQRWLIKDNRITDGHGLLMSGSTTDVRMENNLVVRIQDWCLDGGTSGTSSKGLVGYTWVRNTMYDCGSWWGSGGYGGSYGLLTDGPASGNTLDRNLLASIGFDAIGQFRLGGHNLIGTGAGGGPTDLPFTPQFADRIDYRPTNLPAGYADVGYRPAPAGHLAAP